MVAAGKRRFRVGIQLHPQHCAIADLRTAWRSLDELGEAQHVIVECETPFDPGPVRRLLAAADA